MLGHVVAQQMYKVYGNNALSHCDDTFSYSCFHGVTHKALIQNGVQSTKELMKACDEGSQMIGISCAHGIGHGFLTYRSIDINLALNDCKEEFSGKDGHKNSCYDGAFMEYVYSAPKNTITRENIWDFCRSFSTEEYQYICSYYAILFLQEKQNVSVEESISLCSKAENPRYTEICYRGINLGIAHTAKGNKDTIAKLCSSYKIDSQKHGCLFAAANESKYQKFYNWEDTVKEICSTLTQVSEEFKKGCNNLTLSL